MILKITRNLFARNQSLLSEAGVKLQFWNLRCNPFARNEGWTAKTCVKLRYWNLRWTPFARHEIQSATAGVKIAILQRHQGPLARVLCVKLLCPKVALCKSFCLVMAAWMLHGLCFGEEAGARNLAFFRVKWAAAGDERYLLCAAGAVWIVSMSIGSSAVFCN